MLQCFIAIVAAFQLLRISYLSLGQWENGRINGRGKLSYHNGDEYDGEWLDGRMHGHGTYR